ncbi:MAG: hypothetical protein GXO82_07050 [Chlorobi bacterium]|nr:hypothetical protein [Chlorobiota bacterium]
MFRKLDDFISAYRSLAEGTAKVFAQLTDDNLDQSVAEGHRTLGGLAWHIVTTVPEMMSRTGLGFSTVDWKSMPPSSAREIMEGYAGVSDELLSAVRDNWSDESLLRTDEMYGEQWPRGLTLSALINHEIHHRGQMTVLLRQAGSKVPGVFGPSKEEWKTFGMNEPPY